MAEGRSGERAAGQDAPVVHIRGDVTDLHRREHLAAVNAEIGSAQRVMDRLFHWASVIESSDDAIYTKTLDGTVTGWNSGAERMFGYRAEEIVGQSVAVLFPPDRQDEFTHTMEQLRHGERVDHFETVRQRHDGTTLDVSATISPIRDLTGRLIGVASILRDITEQKAIERRRMAFLAAAGHELKTPLTVQAMAVQAARRHLDRGNTAGVERHLATLDDQVRRLTGLVDSLLSVSHLERGELAVRPTRFPLVTAVQDAVGLVQPASQHAIAVEDTAPRLEVCADRDHVVQILINLLSNAIKYSPEADRVEVRVAAAGEDATVAVHDFGLGIAPVDQARLFAPFVRVGPAAERIPGLGVGLYLSSRLAVAQGGRITVESVPGNGATFVLELPLPPG